MSRVDHRLVAAARRSVNFGLLEPIEPLLALYGAQTSGTRVKIAVEVGRATLIL